MYMCVYVCMRVCLFKNLHNFYVSRGNSVTHTHARIKSYGSLKILKGNN